MGIRSHPFCHQQYHPALLGLTDATSNLGVAAFADWARLKEAFTSQR
jgi:hypothetical protein